MANQNTRTHSFNAVHLNGETHVVGPVNPVPPHCAYCAAPPVTGGTVAGALDVAGGRVGVDGGFDVAGGAVGVEGGFDAGGLALPQEKTCGPGIV